jgi:drug/metabolite transporter superfamily protein YnfA
VWKFQVAMSAILCVVGLLIIAFADRHAGGGLYSGGQVLAVLGGIFIVWITIKRFLFGYTGN